MADDKVNPDEALTEEEIFGQDESRKKPKTALNACTFFLGHLLYLARAELTAC